MSDTKRTVVEIVEPRLVAVHFKGPFDDQMAKEVWDEIQAQVGGEPYFMIEAIMAEIDGTTPEARRISAERLKSLPPRAIAIVGGSFGQRVLAKLVLTATTLLGGGKSVGDFFTDRESARTWLRAYAANRDIGSK